MSLAYFRRLHRQAFHGVLLALLVARGLLAPGVMPAWHDAAPTLVMCTAQGLILGASAADAASATGLAESCAFGMALGLAALPVTAATLGLESPRLPSRESPDGEFRQAPPRHAAARGPPVPV
jgi:hypothetical protein